MNVQGKQYIFFYYIEREVIDCTNDTDKTVDLKINMCFILIINNCFGYFKNFMKFWIYSSLGNSSYLGLR